MKMLVTEESQIFDNSNDYYDLLMKHYVSPTAKVLGWWIHEEYFYYSCPIKGVVYKGGTPLILINRLNDSVIYEEDYSEESVDNRRKEYPYTILTLGCDDGNKGWLFKTEKEALAWFKEFSNCINTSNDSFSSGWEVLHFFESGQVWMN